MRMEKLQEKDYVRDTQNKKLYRVRDFKTFKVYRNSIVADYGLDDRGPIPDRGRGFFF
jgi:hypothetical protein